LGRLLAEGDASRLSTLRTHASDPRWRLREAVAMALQRWGEKNMEALIAAMQEWSLGSPLEQRAAAAALCEPRLLKEPVHARAVLQILDGITASMPGLSHVRGEEFLVLRKGLGYCWSVAVAALPGEGKTLMEKWLGNPNTDIQWIMQENLKKTRLERLDPSWILKWQRKGIRNSEK
jgi:hypothetical protein